MPGGCIHSLVLPMRTSVATAGGWGGADEKPSGQRDGEDAEMGADASGYVFRVGVHRTFGAC